MKRNSNEEKSKVKTNQVVKDSHNKNEEELNINNEMIKIIIKLVKFN